MLAMNFTDCIPLGTQRQAELRWGCKTCTGVDNSTLHELKDRLADPNCSLDRCPQPKEDPIPTAQLFPSCLAQGQSLLVQTTVCRLQGEGFQNCFATLSQGLEIRKHHCPEGEDRIHCDHATAAIVWRLGLERIRTQVYWETACPVEGRGSALGESQDSGTIAVSG